MGWGMECRVEKEAGGALTNTKDLWKSHMETTVEAS